MEIPIRRFITYTDKQQSLAEHSKSLWVEYFCRHWETQPDQHLLSIWDLNWCTTVVLYGLKMSFPNNLRHRHQLQCNAKTLHSILQSFFHFHRVSLHQRALRYAYLHHGVRLNVVLNFLRHYQLVLVWLGICWKEMQICFLNFVLVIVLGQTFTLLLHSSMSYPL